MNYKTLGLIAGLVLTVSLAACSGKTGSTNQVAPASPAEMSTPGGAMSGDAMKKDGDAMQNPGDAMSGDAMKKDGDAMQNPGDAMSGDAMKKDGDAMQSPAKP